MNIKNYKSYKNILKYKNYSWIDLRLDLKILTLSAGLTSSGGLFHKHISDWWSALSCKGGLPQQIFWLGKNVQHNKPSNDKQNEGHIYKIWHPGKGGVK